MEGERSGLWTECRKEVSAGPLESVLPLLPPLAPRSLKTPRLPGHILSLTGPVGSQTGRFTEPVSPGWGPGICFFLFVCFWFCFGKPGLWKAMVVASGFIKDVDSLLPLGKNVGFPEDESVTDG